MRSIENLEHEVKELTKMIQPDEKVRESYFRDLYGVLAEMHYRTMGCYRPDGSMMTDEEFLAEYAKKMGTVDEFVARQMAIPRTALNSLCVLDDAFAGETKEQQENEDRDFSNHLDFSGRFK